MPDYVALKAEIAKPVYAGLDDAATAHAVMGAVVSAESAASGADIGKLWARRGVLGAARERASRTTLTPAQRANAWTAIEMVAQDGFSGFDPSVPAQRAALVAMLDGFVADTIMTAADRTATLAMLARPRSGRDVFGAIDENDIAIARAL